MIKISVLGHPDELVGQLMSNLIQQYHGQTTNHTFEAISISISTLRIFLDNRWVKLILVRPIGRGFFDKMYEHHFSSNGAIIAFSKGNADSFEAARAFYQQFRYINDDPHVPVAFVEIQDKLTDLILDDVIKLKQGPSDFYHGLESEDFEGFRTILLSLITHNLARKRAAPRAPSEKVPWRSERSV